tara:strand:+ start:492 stop:1316 length:825 start_codon:yes stop_codon:yes gene_type:complete
MAQVIKIKRSTGTSAPGTLAQGELAYSKGSDTFYVGDPAAANTPIAIGGAIKNNAGSPVLATGITADEIASLILPAISSNITLGDATDVTFTTSGSVVVTGNLTVNGTTTTVNSTTTTVDDPIFTIGGDSAPGSDDNKDRGIEFRYHTGSGAKVGFFGYDDSASKFTFIPDATNSSEVFSGSVGTILANLEGSLTTGGHTMNDIDVAGEFNDVDDHLMTSAAINDRILSFGYGTGDITQVVVSSTDSSITGGGTGATGNISFDLQVGTIDGGTY